MPLMNYVPNKNEIVASKASPYVQLNYTISLLAHLARMVKKVFNAKHQYYSTKYIGARRSAGLNLPLWLVFPGFTSGTLNDSERSVPSTSLY